MFQEAEEVNNFSRVWEYLFTQPHSTSQSVSSDRQSPMHVHFIVLFLFPTPSFGTRVHAHTPLPSQLLARTRSQARTHTPPTLNTRACLSPPGIELTAAPGCSSRQEGLSYLTHFPDLSPDLLCHTLSYPPHSPRGCTTCALVPTGPGPCDPAPATPRLSALVSPGWLTLAITLHGRAHTHTFRHSHLPPTGADDLTARARRGPARPQIGWPRLRGTSKPERELQLWRNGRN